MYKLKHVPTKKKDTFANNHRRWTPPMIIKHSWRYDLQPRRCHSEKAVQSGGLTFYK
jgi:hypothetical protein